MDLRKRLLNGQNKVAVWGTGYIGFSTMANFAASGVACVGTDVSPEIVSSINRGQIPVANMEYWLGYDTRYLVESKMMSATTEWKKVTTEDFAVHMIAIPTEKGEKPWDGALEDVVNKIASSYKSLPKPPVVIIESTLTPNKTDNLVIPIFQKYGIEVESDVILGVAPRRDWFISPEKNLKTLPRIVGGTTPKSTHEIMNILSVICDHLIAAPDHRHAEIVKSVENAFRHVEITLANQLSLAYPNLNMTEVLRLVGTKWNIGTFHPSFGTGGYCIPLSSKYVLEGAKEPDRLTILKDTVVADEALPVLIADRIADAGFAKVGILGLSYKGDLKVHILSPTLRISRRLIERGVAVKVNDPYYDVDEIKKITGTGSFQFPAELVEFDCILIVAGHRRYKAISQEQLKTNLKNCRMVIDNLEEAWKDFDWDSMGIDYVIVGDKNWLIKKQ